MSKIVIGKAGGKNVAIDLHLLLTTRLLVTADSGGGKTWLLKRICEQASGKVQIIILDPEGEFAPLRENLPFVLAGKGGETPTDVRTAEKLALTLLQSRANAVCDLYEMKADARHEWVRIFLEATLEAPKSLRHPCLMIVDEAHMFCPEKGMGESTATDAMKGLCTRGRKRLLCAIFATQRLATLAKDASSMLLNRLIGPTFEDVNRKRASMVLGIEQVKGELSKFYKEIQLLEPGNFYALGRAISRERLLVHVGNIETPHGDEARKYEIEPPPPPEKIRALLPKLSDLPRAAEEEAKTVADFKKQIRELKVELRQKSVAPVSNRSVVTPKTDPRAIERAVREATKKFAPLKALMEQLMKITVKVSAVGFDGSALKPEEISAALEKTAKEIARQAQSKLTARSQEFERLKKETNRVLLQLQKLLESENVAVDLTVRKQEPIEVRATPIHRTVAEAADSNGFSATGSQRRILDALAEFEALGRNEVAKETIAAMAGASSSSSSYGNNLGALRTAGYLHYPRVGFLALTDAGRGLTNAAEAPTSSSEILGRCVRVITGPQGRILSELHAAHPDSLSKAELAERVGASPASSSYGNNLGALRTAGMITYPAPGEAKAADWLFLD